MTLTRRHLLALSGAATAAFALPAWAGEPATLGGAAFGSYWRISLAAPAGLASVRRHIEAIIATIDSAMSPYRPGSEISRFNALRSSDWVELSGETHTVVSAALSMAESCDGAFDPTVGPLVGRYGFGPIQGARTGSFAQLALRPDAIRKQDASLSLDLCGIAKGFALDLMAARLDAEGHANYLIELGGEVFARGRHPSGRSWQVAIEKPVPGQTALAHLVGLNGKAIATSGDAINAYQLGNRRISHIIDPHTGAPVTGDIASVSVLAETGMKADAFATALMAMGLEAGAAFAQDHNIDALFLTRDGGSFKTTLTGAFAEHLLS